MNYETRQYEAPELRFSDENTGTFDGYAAVFGEPNAFGEIIERGAFKKTLRERSPAMFWSHDPHEPIGIWESLEEDERGLKVRGRLIQETRRGSEAFALLKAKAVSGLSIGFRSRADKRGPNGVRVLTDVELVEISVVSLPAANSARITQVRSEDRHADLTKFTSTAREVARVVRGLHVDHS